MNPLHPESTDRSVPTAPVALPPEAIPLALLHVDIQTAIRRRAVGLTTQFAGHSVHVAVRRVTDDAVTIGRCASPFARPGVTPPPEAVSVAVLPESHA